MTTTRLEHHRLARPVVAVLITASLASGVFIPLAGRRALPEHLAVLAAIAALTLAAAITRRFRWTITRFTVLAVAWVAANALSSIAFSPEPWESAVHVARLGLLAATFIIVASAPKPEPDEWLWLLRLWLWLGTAELIYGLITWMLAGTSVAWLPGARLVPGIPGISIQGTMFERNFFGILAATVTLVAWYLLLAENGRGRPAVVRRTTLLMILAVAAGALMIALTRSAWIAAALTVPVALGMAWWRTGARPDARLVAVAVAAPVVFAVLQSVLTPGAAAMADSPFSERFATMTPDGLADDFTVRTRLEDARMALEDFAASPILGHGTGSFFMKHGIRAGTRAWISNMTLHILVDTGVVGLLIQLALVLAVVVGGWTASVTTRDPRVAAGLQALLLGLLIIGVTYQITDGSWLAVYWIHLGLIAHGIACVDRERHATDVTV